MLITKPLKLSRLVAGIVAQSPLPVTVKIRIGENDSKLNVHRLVPLLERAGAAAGIIHGRTTDARYRYTSPRCVLCTLACQATR